MPLYD